MLPPSPTQYPMPVPTTATTTQALILPEDFSWGLLPALGTVLKRGPCGPSVQVRCAAFSMSMMVRGLPVLPSSVVSFPV